MNATIISVQVERVELTGDHTIDDNGSIRHEVGQQCWRSRGNEPAKAHRASRYSRPVAGSKKTSRHPSFLCRPKAVTASSRRYVLLLLVAISEGSSYVA